MKKRLGWTAGWRLTVIFAGLGGAVGSCAPDEAPTGAPPAETPLAVAAGEVEAADVEIAVEADGLAEAFDRFKRDFGPGDTLRIGLGFHAGMSTERLAVNDVPAAATVSFTFPERDVNANLFGIPAGTGSQFELWLVKNKPAPNGGNTMTVMPEKDDELVRVGAFTTTTFGETLQVKSFSKITFDFDLAVVTRKGKNPTTSRVLVGARSLFEKRFYRKRHNLPSPAIGAQRASTVETKDPLVRRGAQLFFNETFAGNGRTCGTCHPSRRSTVIDAEFITGLPESDPLKVAKKGTPLAELEDDVQLRENALIRVNADGFDRPSVLRSVPPIQALTAGLDIKFGSSIFPIAPPDNLTGWSGDGSTGRGTLHEFTFQAIMQHATKTMARRPGIDFRIPTQEETDAIEAFMLFNGRQRVPDVKGMRFKDAEANEGRTIFFDDGPNTFGSKCTMCHFDLIGDALGTLVSTGTQDRTRNFLDDGFKQAGKTPLPSKSFSIPTLIESADTGPFFHNNSASTIEFAVGHYMTSEFRNSPAGMAVGAITLSPTAAQAIAAFLREINAAENIRQVRTRVSFVIANRSTNDEILDVAIADTNDAFNVLNGRNLNQAARDQLTAAKAALTAARAIKDSQKRADHLRVNALPRIQAATAALIDVDPNTYF